MAKEEKSLTLEELFGAINNLRDIDFEEEGKKLKKRFGKKFAEWEALAKKKEFSAIPSEQVYSGSKDKENYYVRDYFINVYGAVSMRGFVK